MTEPHFQALQRRFAAHLRDPARQPAPAGLEERRLRIYRELFYNNVEDFLANAFPVLRKLSSDAVWHARVRDFYARHRCQDPQFSGIAQEFLDFLEHERGAHADDPPFLRELAHYEWVELALAIAEEPAPGDTDTGPVDPQGDLLGGRPLLSPLAWPQAYLWPVHRIGPAHQPHTPPLEPTYLVVYRNREDEVRFMELNAVSARLLQLIEEQPQASGRERLLQIAAELGHPDPDRVVEEGTIILDELRARDILLGTQA
jgi:hypothetical protein